MAEYLLRGRIGPDSPWTVGSAGLAAADGLAASQTAVEVMNEIGINIKSHHSRQLARELIDTATIILVMTNDQALEVKKRFPEACDRVHLLGSFNRDSGNYATSACGGHHWRTPAAEKEIADPVGAGIEVYRRILSDIAGCIDGLIRYLKAYERK